MCNKDTTTTVRNRPQQPLPRPTSVRAMLRASCVLLVAFITCVCGNANADTSSMTEYQLKAAYLFNFVAFTEWPADLGTSLSLCIYGPDPFGADIDKFDGENVNGHLVEVARITSADELGNCDIVFISSKVISNVRRVLDRTDHHPMLTVADSPGAAASGVSLNMNMEDDKVTFEVNLAALRNSKLEISFQLLRLAKKVHQ
jgi:hypothetical protein